MKRQNADEPESLMDLICNKKGLKVSLGKNTAPLTLFPYKAVMCRACGKIQVTQGEEMFRCRECGKANRYRKNGAWNVRLKDFPTFEAAMIEAKRWAMEEVKKDEEKGII
jgi:predicted RNA-binding Zn-ribbon protein involved in translation (DUF1610 family)